MQFDYEAVPQDGDCYKVAKFRFYCDRKQAKTLKALIVVTPGSGGDGRHEIGDWERFAREHNCGVIGVYFADVDFKVDEDYIDAKSGSGQALLSAIDSFEERGDIPVDLPLLMWGHSAGGEFNYEFACWRPERVAAFVVNKGGIYYTGLAPTETRRIRAMFFTGQDDAFYRKAAVYGIFFMGRAAGAPSWQHHEEAKVGHAIGVSLWASRNMFIQVLKEMK